MCRAAAASCCAAEGSSCRAFGEWGGLKNPISPGGRVCCSPCQGIQAKVVFYDLKLAWAVAFAWRLPWHANKPNCPLNYPRLLTTRHASNQLLQTGILLRARALHARDDILRMRRVHRPRVSLLMSVAQKDRQNPVATHIHRAAQSIVLTPFPISSPPRHGAFDRRLRHLAVSPMYRRQYNAGLAPAPKALRNLRLCTASVPNKICWPIPCLAQPSCIHGLVLLSMLRWSLRYSGCGGKCKRPVIFLP